jgi:Asp/Glu/hydantoin racemase
VRILVVNPNTSSDMLALLLAEARAACRPGTEVSGVAAEFGVPQIGNRVEMALAGHALLEVVARHAPGHDAVVVGAFYQALVPAVKELLPVPVIGLAEAALGAARLLGSRIAILGLGSSERGLMEELAAALGVSDALVGVRALPLSGAALMADPAGADAAVVALGLAAVGEDGADVLVLGGAAFAGMAARIAPKLPVPLVSPVGYAVGLAELVVLSGWRKPTVGAYAAPEAKSTIGLGAALASMFPSPRE